MSDPTDAHGADAAGPDRSDMPKQRWILAVAGLWLASWVAGAPAASGAGSPSGASYAIDVWDTEDGLPQNSVIAMVQTRDGYLWLGTLNGLVRFDGIRFTVFDESNTPGLNSSRIVRLFEDRAGRLWIGTETAGIALVQDGLVTTPAELALGGSDRRLVAVCEDAQGAVWFYNVNGEIWRCGNGRFAPFVLGPNEPSACRTLIAERDGPVWVGTDQRQCAIGPVGLDDSLDLPVAAEVPARKLDLLLASASGGYWRLADGRVQKWTTNRFERDLGPYPWRRPPVAACEDPQGNLVVGTLGEGVYWFEADGHATRLSTEQGLSYDTVLSLLVDREGSLWVGTDGGGLNRVKRQDFHVLDVSQSPADRAVQTVCADAEGGLWIGSIGGGVVRWTENHTQRFGPAQGLINPYVWAVWVETPQRVWVGTWGGGLFRLQDGHVQRVPGADVVPSRIHALFQDRAGRLWVGGQGGLARWDGRDWRLFTPADGLSANEVQALAEDADGSLWIGTVGGGLNRLRDDRFTAWRKKDGFPSDNISALWADAEGVLWVGTVGSGLVRFEGGAWTHYTTREGLHGNSVSYLIEDDRGFLWIGSNTGLMRVPKKALNDLARGVNAFLPGRAFGRADGLPTRECTTGSQPAAWRTPDGRLWFPTIKGVVSVNPAQLRPNTNPPPVVIEAVWIEGRLQTTNLLRGAAPSAVIVPARKERLEIQYTSLNLAAPERARFRYRLDGHETAWTEARNERIARYSKLPPGQYRFQVTACNEDGVWNPTGCTLAVVVLPPFWRTWWFLGGTALGLLSSIVAAVHFVSTQKLQRQLEALRQKEALEKERARIARDLHDQLGANLTQVALLGEMVESDKDLPHEVEAHARQICQTARETARALDEIVWAANPANDTLEGLVNYACKYAQDYLALAGLRYRLEVPPQLPATVLAPETRHNVFLAFKEAVNNVVKHAQASAVHVRLKLEPDAFTLEVEDNGRGLRGLDEERARTRNGLRNMRKRMEDVGGRFSIGPAPAGGTRVCLWAPMVRR